MPWVVDTFVLIDVLDDDPHFGKTSAACLQNMLHEGLIVAPVSFIELAPAFMGNQQKQKIGNISKRPIADIIIGAFASRFAGIITRNEKDFRTIFPDMEIIVPCSAQAQWRP